MSFVINNADLLPWKFPYFSNAALWLLCMVQTRTRLNFI